ncbi:MAG TPA: response regulator [Bryobacteraceae bacterium]|nr:response regulator [Bryobacteraceae bacterium]
MKTLRILLAEDNPADVILVRHALEEHRISHELRVVTDGLDAIEFVASIGQAQSLDWPDILLLDLNLPRADGSEVLRAFREHPQGGATPVIVVTSSAAKADRQRVEPLGISRYFQKPVDFDGFMRLGAVVKEVVSGSHA